MNADQQPIASEPTEQPKPHNPDQLSPEQVGVSEGWRLLDADEIVAAPQLVAIQSWSTNFGEWVKFGDGYGGINSRFTYRTLLTRAELRKARGQPEQPKPEPETRSGHLYAAMESAVSHHIPVEYIQQIQSRLEAVGDERDAALAENARLKEEAVRLREWAGRCQQEMEHQARLAMDARETIKEAK